jgi:hypothetical protein
MRMFKPGWAFSIAALAAGAVLLMHPQTSATVELSQRRASSFLIVFGLGDTTPSAWDGSIAVQAAEVLSVEGWRFDDTDQIDGLNWKLSTHAIDNPTTVPGAPPQLGLPGSGMGRLASIENGVIVTISAPGEAVTCTVMTAQGSIQFSCASLPYGRQMRFLNGRVLVERVPAALQLTNSIEEEDFPAIAKTEDDVWVSFVRFVHGDRSLAQEMSIASEPPSFDFLARPTGRASDEIRITSDGGADLNPVAATDAGGRVWVAWQGFRKGNLEVLAAVEQGDGMSSEAVVSFSPASDWDPAIAAAPNGEVAISWDTYDKGDYDVYARRAHFDGGIAARRSNSGGRITQLRGPQLDRL